VILKVENILTKVEYATGAELELLHAYFDDEDHNRSVFVNDRYFYTGLIPWLQKQGLTLEGLPQHKRSVVSVDAKLLKGKELRDYQVSATRKAIYAERGIVQAATGAGKTLMAAYLIAHLRRDGLAESVLYIVPTVPLMEQTAKELRSLGITSVTTAGGGTKPNLKATCVVSVVDTAYNSIKSSKPFAENIRDSEVIILDEAHHAPSNKWTTICEACQAKYRVAYTATAHDDPEKYSFSDLVLYGLVGPIIFEVRSKELRDRGYLAEPLVTILDGAKGNIPLYNWQSVYDIGIVKNKLRNSLIVSLAASCYQADNKVMIFVNRKSHGHALAKALAIKCGCDSLFAHGGSTCFEYKAATASSHRKNFAIKDIAKYVNTRNRAIVLSTSIFDEGVDLPIINVLVMATGMKKYRRTVQRCGRGMRPKEGSNRVFIFDFYDESHPFLEKQSKYRIWTYKEEEFRISTSLSEAEKVMGTKLDLQKGLFYEK
jgi:superfamily II DNA or RNA helicase